VIKARELINLLEGHGFKRPIPKFASLGSNLFKPVDSYGIEFGNQVIDIDLKELDKSVFNGSLKGLNNKSKRYVVFVNGRYKTSAQRMINKLGEYDLLANYKSDAMREINSIQSSADRFNKEYSMAKKFKNPFMQVKSMVDIANAFKTKYGVTIDIPDELKDFVR
jgi:hypothetical protein